MKKRNTIIYWITTIWLFTGMVSTGLVQLLQIEEQVKEIVAMGYPLYFLSILGALKIIGALVVLVPGLPLLKEWTYAGFFFTMTGAVSSHLIAGKGITDALPALLLLALTIVSWYFRPANRKLELGTRYQELGTRD